MIRTNNLARALEIARQNGFNPRLIHDAIHNAKVIEDMGLEVVFELDVEPHVAQDPDHYHGA